MSSTLKKNLLLFLVSNFLSCAHKKPYSDIAATTIAIEYMKKAGALQKAPLLFKKAMHYYTQANELLSQKENTAAKKYLHLARTYAERAEFQSRTQENKTQEEW